MRRLRSVLGTSGCPDLDAHRKGWKASSQQLFLQPRLKVSQFGCHVGIGRDQRPAFVVDRSRRYMSHDWMAAKRLADSSRRRRSEASGLLRLSASPRVRASGTDGAALLMLVSSVGRVSGTASRDRFVAMPDGDTMPGGKLSECLYGRGHPDSPSARSGRPTGPAATTPYPVTPHVAQDTHPNFRQSQ